jgi:hypothetical protein
LLDQHRQIAGGIGNQEIAAPLIGLFLDQLRFESLFSHHRPYEAGAGAEWIMKQIRHASTQSITQRAARGDHLLNA